MAHKVHPKSYRLKNLADWDSRWLERKKTPQYLEEDFKIRSFLKEKIGKFSVEKIQIERFAGKLSVIIFTSRPGMIIGRGGEGIEDLRKELLRKIFKITPQKNVQANAGRQKTGFDLRLEIREIKDPWSSAALTGQWVAQQLEKRTPYRRVLKQTLDKIMAVKQNQGARVEISGRLEGADIARREWLKKGNLPRQTLRADIDYALVEAKIPQGTIGIKVWIYKGEKFD